VYLKRVEWDSSKFPVRLYLFVFADEPNEKHSIVIDPRIAFGRPVLLRKGISTSAIADRIDAGETVEDLAADYDLDASEIERAALYGCLSLVYFTDRDLGKRFPEILRSSGLTVERHADHFAP
jgi:uncharacterized protein (DUF433 family)